LRLSEKSRRAASALALIAVVYLCFFAGLDRFGFVGPDEPRYASIAREMAQSGDWVTPRLNGSPWFEKPPLYYWSAAIGFRLFSSPETAARAPSGVFALCALLGILLLARRIYGPDVAEMAGWMLPVTVAMIGFAHASAPDMPFAGCLTLAMAAAAHLLLDDEPLHPRAWAVGFGAALGLATLAKGPAAVLLAGGSTALWAVATGNIRKAWRLCQPAAVLVFCAVALPWFALCAARNPDFLRVFLFEHNVERFLTNRYQHSQPFWFFVPILLVAMFPWTLLLAPGLADAWRSFRNGEWRQAPGTFFAAWAVFPFVFFSASQSKLPGYILPAIPPLVLLLADSLVRPTRDDRPAVPFWVRWLGVTLTITGAVVLAICFFLPNRLPMEIIAPVSTGPTVLQMLIYVAIDMFIFGVAALGYFYGRRRIPGVRFFALILLFVILNGAYGLLTVLDPQISPRMLSMVARILVQSPAQITTYRLPRAWQYGFEFYLPGPLPEWTPVMPRPVWVLTSDTGLAELKRQGVRLTAESRMWSKAELVRVE
jgi:4-amino-4-deoxy-L-arabinose transferase-like glycosyltransferase